MSSMMKCIKIFLIWFLFIFIICSCWRAYNNFFVIPEYEKRAKYLLNEIESYRLKYGLYPKRIETIITEYDVAYTQMILPKNMIGSGGVDYVLYRDGSYILIIGGYSEPNVIYRSWKKIFDYNYDTLD